MCPLEHNLQQGSQREQGHWGHLVPLGVSGSRPLTPDTQDKRPPPFIHGTSPLDTKRQKRLRGRQNEHALFSETSKMIILFPHKRNSFPKRFKPRSVQKCHSRLL